MIESLDFADPFAAMELRTIGTASRKLNIDAAQKLQAAGADGLLIACNTTPQGL